MNRVQGGARRTPPPAQQPRTQSEPPAPARQQSSPAQSAPAPKPQNETPTGEPGIDAIRNRWGQIKADVHAVNVRIGALLSEMDPAGLEGNKVILTVPYTFHAQKMNSDETREVVESVISRVMGNPHSLECFTTDEYRSRPARKGPSTPSPQATESSATEDAPDLGNQAATQEPQIDPTESLRAVRNIFDAEEIDTPDS